MSERRSSRSFEVQSLSGVAPFTVGRLWLSTRNCVRMRRELASRLIWLIMSVATLSLVAMFLRTSHDVWAFLLGVAPMPCAIAIPIGRLLRGASFKHTFVLCWAMLVTLYAFWALVLPLTLLTIAPRTFGAVPHTFDSLSAYTPNPVGVPVMVFVGWAYSGVVLLPVWVVRIVIQRRRTHNAQLLTDSAAL